MYKVIDKLKVAVNFYYDNIEGLEIKKMFTLKEIVQLIMQKHV